MEITSPVISLHGSGQTIVLENRFAGFMLSQGTTGLGVAPREVTTDPVASGGSILRHRRFEEAEMEIPIVLTGDYYTKRERRRKLEELVKGEVELRLRHPDGITRSRFGYLTEGVEGDYSSGTDFQDAYKMVLSFVCPDPWWYGSERVLRQKVAAVRKPFITHTVEPVDPESVVLERSSVERAPFLPIVLAPSVINGSYELKIQGDNDVWPVWEIEGPGEDLLLDNKTTGELFFMEGEFKDNVTIDAKNMELSSPGLTNGELWDRVPATYQGKANLPFKLSPGVNNVVISIVSADRNTRVTLRYREVWRSGQ